MGAVNQVVQAVSDTVSHVGQVISESPIAQAAITVGGAMVGIPPQVTAGLLAANSVGQGQSLEQAALTGGLSYLGGTGIDNYAATGSVFGEGGASGLFGMGGSGTAGAAGATAAEQGAAQALISQGYSPSAAWELVNAGQAGVASTFGAQAAGAGATTGLGGLWNQFTSQPGALSGAMQLAGSYLNQNAASDAAATQAQAQIRAAQIAADAAKFRPVGVTTNFGSSKFGYDSNGNLVSAGYALNPVLQGQQNQIMQSTPGLLAQYTGVQAATAPMGDAAQRAMTLGNQYLTADPVAQAQKYMADQRAVLAAGDASKLAELRANLAATGRAGLMTGGDAGMLQANPDMAAYYNSIAQRDLQLAANAMQGGMDYAKFGAGLSGTGGDLLSSMYKTQTNAASPYTTALGTAQSIENMGQGAMDLGTSIGDKSSTATANAGLLQGQGIQNAANTMVPVNAYSPWGSLLTGGANMLQNYKFGA